MRIENRFSQFFEKFRKEPIPVNSETSQEQLDLQFAMEANGFYLSDLGEWKIDKKLWNKVNKDLFPKNVVQGISNNHEYGEVLARALQQKSVLETVGKYREFDENIAREMCFLLGSIVRHLGDNSDLASSERAVKAMEFTARMVNLARFQMGENIAIPLVLYLLSGGSFEKDTHFEKNVSHMAEAISQDYYPLQETEQLGLSQALRLKSFTRKIQNTEGSEISPYYYSSKHTKAFAGFPTIGAEFHIPSSSETFNNFCKEWLSLTCPNINGGHLSRFQKVIRA